MSERAAVTKAKARAYAVADRARKTAILDELVDLTAQDRHQDLEHRSQTLACRSTQHRPALDQRHDDPGPIRRPPRPPSLDHPQLQPPREASNSRRLRTPTLAKTFLRWSCTVYGDTSLTCAEGVRRGHDRRDLGDLLRIHHHAHAAVRPVVEQPPATRATTVRHLDKARLRSAGGSRLWFRPNVAVAQSARTPQRRTAA